MSKHDMSTEFIIDTNFQTPEPVADYMARIAARYWFNKTKYTGDIPTVLDPTPGLGSLISSGNKMNFNMCGPIGDYWQSLFYRSVNPFDMIIMNPPFNPVKEMERFVLDAMKKSPYIVVLLPWYYIINSDRRLQVLVDFGLVSVTSLPRKTFPGARVQCAIFELKSTHEGNYQTIFKTFTW